MLWYLALAVAGRRLEVQLPHIPSVFLAAVASACALLLTLIFPIFVGPLLLLLLLPRPFLATFKVLRRKSEFSRGARRVVARMAIMAAVAFAVSGVVEFRRAAGMDEAEKIAMWSGTATSRIWQRRLQAAEPASLPQYRKLLRIAPASYEAVESARRLIAAGDPATELPHIVEAARRAAQIPDSYIVPSYRKVLESATSTSLPATSTPEQWPQLLSANNAM